MHHYFLRCEPCLVKIATFSWPPFVTNGFGKVSWSQIYPWKRSWLNKNRFQEKEAGQFLLINGIYCVLLAINSSKQRKDNQCLACYRWCLLSVYHDIVTCSQWKLKKLSFFISFADNHISPYFLMLVWWQKSRNEINYSHFFRGGWRGVLQWCNVRAHKRIISACTIDFRPTLTYQSTSADLRQQSLTSFCAVYGVLFY